MTGYPQILQKLMTSLRKLPGVGKKSAERFAFQMISWPDKELTDYAQLLLDLKKNLHTCPVCGVLQDNPSCDMCNPQKRDQTMLCIVSSPKDVYAIEATRIFNGMYHVMPGLLSPLEGIGPDQLQIEPLLNRMQELGTKEVMLAFDSTIEGDATSLYLKQALAPLPLFVSRLALGIPLGSSLDLIDEGTLHRAILSRHTF